MQYQTRSDAAIGETDTARPAGVAPRRASPAARDTSPPVLNLDAPALAAPSLLMSSAWSRLLGALVLIGLLWLAVAWALAGTAA